MLGKQLKLLREQNGYSQNQIAEYLGTTRQTISNWENDKTIIDSHSLIRLADFYQISLDELCGRKMISVYKNSKIKSMILDNACTLWTCFTSAHR
ncbi:helix-turn-helix domain-containing protein [Streptococcus gordonii]|uniref:helix-turn-helix domain-containing protein n=1 Tax=Streptococcus gordonii TaxID=1302 RepID=UPI001EDCB549|nr:helix-turn-helix transcriptional regulator [Streptococcus gordonii]MCG4822444.1 helix-turn-helix domain-containing protein [Streptococcus gordonii]MCG4847543.1 helix-turn-helix domain-containing protein [Streptococcus gordonii]MDE8686374.1 helix-turn-helix transcriptional regulator [Streptococcus gordonii]